MALKATPQPLRNPIATVPDGKITKAWADYLTAIDKSTPGIIFGTHAERIADHDPITQEIGAQFYEIDRGLLYMNVQKRILTFVDADSASGAPDLNVDSTDDFVVGQTVYIAAGTAREERRVIQSISAGVSLTFTTNLTYTHTAADRDTVVSWSNEREWNYVTGTMTAPLAYEPTDLGASDAGVLYQVTTGTGTAQYYHLARWTGTGWETADKWGGYLEMRTIAPVEPGWVLCDGVPSALCLTLVAGVLTEAIVGLDNFQDGVYFKGGPVYGGLTIAEDHGTIIGHTADTSGGTPSGTVSGTTGSAGSSVAVSSGSGTTVATDSHTHSFSGTLTGSALPDHHHDPGTLEVQGLDMKHIQILPYFRQ